MNINYEAFSDKLVFSIFARSPKLSFCNASGISNEDVSKLQNELQCMAANLVGEVRYETYRSLLLNILTTTVQMAE